MGVKAIAMRCAGYDRVDLPAAARLGLTVLRVPAYSPSAVAEHAVTLMCALNRHLKKGLDRSRHCNFDLSGLVGRDISAATVGVVGTGRIGMLFARILHGFGAKLLAYDVYQSPGENKGVANCVLLHKVRFFSLMRDPRIPLSLNAMHP